MATQAEIQAENERAIRDWNNRPHRRVVSPSLRNPDMSWHFNHADRIERQLQEDGHRTWGFVIYRTCYGNDEDWAELLKRLRLMMEKSFDFWNGRDILALFSLTVIEDPEHLVEVSTAVVREHFRQWCVTAPQSEQQQGDTGNEMRPGLSPRYRYAIQVDAASLHSVVHDAPAPPKPDFAKQGWVKLIDASWQSVEGPVQYPFEPIEGVMRNNVGWMKIPYSGLDEYYVLCRNLNWWVTSYQRPPIVMGYPYNC